MARESGGRLPRLLLALAVLVGAGIATVWEHVRTVRAGYRLNGLEVEREKLREERRRLEIKHADEARFMGAKRGKEPATPEDLATAAHEVAQALGYDVGRERLLLSRFTNAEGKPIGFCWIERRMTEDRAERLRAAKVRGVSFKDE